MAKKLILFDAGRRRQKWLLLLSIIVLGEVGVLTKGYCELAGRNLPVVGDIILSFVEMGKLRAAIKIMFALGCVLGIDFGKLEEYARSKKLPILPQLQPQQPQKQIAMLQAGTKQPLSNHIPQHLPQFPDPHAYVRTPVSFIISITNGRQHWIIRVYIHIKVLQNIFLNCRKVLVPRNFFTFWSKI